MTTNAPFFPSSRQPVTATFHLEPEPRSTPSLELDISSMDTLATCRRCGAPGMIARKIDPDNVSLELISCVACSTMTELYPVTRGLARTAWNSGRYAPPDAETKRAAILNTLVFLALAAFSVAVTLRALIWLFRLFRDLL